MRFEIFAYRPLHAPWCMILPVAGWSRWSKSRWFWIEETFEIVHEREVHLPLWDLSRSESVACVAMVNFRLIWRSHRLKEPEWVSEGVQTLYDDSDSDSTVDRKQDQYIGRGWLFPVKMGAIQLVVILIHCTTRRNWFFWRRKVIREVPVDRNARLCPYAAVIGILLEPYIPGWIMSAKWRKSEWSVQQK